MNALNPLRHLKHRLQREFGRILLRSAARNPTENRITKMRNALKIQLTPEEMLLISKSVQQHRKANLLVFGTGLDSEYWYRLNHKGYTLFLEDDLSWVRRAKSVVPYLSIEHMQYDTVRTDWNLLIGKDEDLAVGLPSRAMDHAWNVILVDGPRGYEDSDPGRMKSIYQAASLAKTGTDVFVHDCDREIERKYCDFYLKDFELMGTIGRLRHYKRRF